MLLAEDIRWQFPALSLSLFLSLSLSLSLPFSPSLSLPIYIYYPSFSLYLSISTIGAVFYAFFFLFGFFPYASILQAYYPMIELKIHLASSCMWHSYPRGKAARRMPSWPWTEVWSSQEAGLSLCHGYDCCSLSELSHPCHSDWKIKGEM